MGVSPAEHVEPPGQPMQLYGRKEPSGQPIEMRDGHSRATRCGHAGDVGDTHAEALAVLGQQQQGAVRQFVLELLHLCLQAAPGSELRVLRGGDSPRWSKRQKKREHGPKMDTTGTSEPEGTQMAPKWNKLHRNNPK